MDEELLHVNCGQCGRPLVARIDDLGDQRTVTCSRCTATNALRLSDYADRGTASPPAHRTKRKL
jgi:hypothetical protein